MSPVAALLERDPELRALAGAVAAATSGQGSMVVLEGPAGTGKSALIAAADEAAKAAGLDVLRARGSELEREFGFGAIRQLFEADLAGREDDVRDRLFSGAARPAERALQPDGAPASDGFAALHAIYWLTANRAADGPLLLAVDDAHWADASSLRALGYLAGRVAELPVTLLVSLRTHEPGSPEELLDGLRTSPGAVRLTPTALSAPAVAAILRARFPDAPDAVCDAFHETTAGNPFLLQELILAATTGGALSAPDPVAALHESSVTPLGDRVVRRVARVDPDAPALAAAMAVLGSGGRLTTAAALAGIAADRAGPIAHGLRRIEVLADEDPFEFTHPLVRRSIYDALPAAERNRLHGAAAAIVRRAANGSVEPVAAQLAPLPPARSEAVAAVLTEAAFHARARGAPDEAVRWFERALEEDAAEPPRGEILEGLGLTLANLRDPGAIPHLGEALELAVATAPRVRLAIALAELQAQMGEWDAALDVLDSVEPAAVDVDPESRAELAAVRAGTTTYDPARASGFGPDQAALEELAAGPGWAAHALAGVLAIKVLHRGGAVDHARALAERALEGGRLIGERAAGSWAPVHALGTLVELDEYARALAACDELKAAATEQGAVMGQLTAQGVRGWVSVRRGNLPAGEAELRSAMEVAQVADRPMAATTCLFWIYDVLVERPGNDDLAAFVESIELPPAFASTWSGAYFLLVRGTLRVLARDADRGRDDLRAAYTIQSALEWGPTAAPVRSVLALALPASERDEALRLAHEELDLAREATVPRGIGAALRTVGVLEEGDEAIVALRESVAVLEEVDARLERARSHVDLGAALRRAHHRAEARAMLASGMELAHACGAVRLVGRARDELHAAGARPRRVTASGVDSLTPSERRVADLAARAATNPEIAQELFVTLKTVETHLTHAYAKLGLSGAGARGRLVAVLEAA